MQIFGTGIPNHKSQKLFFGGETLVIISYSIFKQIQWMPKGQTMVNVNDPFVNVTNSFLSRSQRIGRPGTKATGI